MKEFEFNGVRYYSHRREDGVTIVTHSPTDRDSRDQRMTKESKSHKHDDIPDHLRRLNKKQLRARIIELENIMGSSP